MSQKQPKPVGGRVQMNRRSLLKSALAVAAGNALWVPRIAKAATEIPIGVVVGLTGAGADYGRDALRAFQLVVDRVNRNGGIKAHGGAKVVLHIADHQTDLRVTSSETERLITRQNVLAILGWAASGSARVGSQVSERYSVPSIDTSVDYKLTERGLKYFYRAAINTRQTCERGVEFVAEMEKTSGVPVKRVMILHEDLAYGTGAGDIFQAAIERIGRWELVDRVAYTASKLTEATGIVNKIKALNVDVVFQASYPADGILIQRAMKQLRLNLFANVHPAGAPPNLQYVESLKDDANFVITVLGWTPNMTGRLPAGAKATVAEYNGLFAQCGGSHDRGAGAGQEPRSRGDLGRDRQDRCQLRPGPERHHSFRRKMGREARQCESAAGRDSDSGSRARRRFPQGSRRQGSRGSAAPLGGAWLAGRGR
jgi:branched-chain amino acid transport system substrate-binding protein